jgi:hypothetical protein
MPQAAAASVLLRIRSKMLISSSSAFAMFNAHKCCRAPELALRIDLVLVVYAWAWWCRRSGLLALTRTGRSLWALRPAAL